MVEVLIDEMSGSDRSRPKDYERAVVVSGQNPEQPRPLEGVAGRSLSKKDLTGPTLLEMSKKDLTGPTLLEMPDKRCGLNRSMQHHLV
jgi:hypothetical protein